MELVCRCAQMLSSKPSALVVRVEPQRRPTSQPVAKPAQIWPTALSPNCGTRATESNHIFIHNSRLRKLFTSPDSPPTPYCCGLSQPDPRSSRAPTTFLVPARVFVTGPGSEVGKPSHVVKQCIFPIGSGERMAGAGESVCSVEAGGCGRARWFVCAIGRTRTGARAPEPSRLPARPSLALTSRTAEAFDPTRATQPSDTHLTSSLQLKRAEAHKPIGSEFWHGYPPERELRPRAGFSGPATAGSRAELP